MPNIDNLPNCNEEFDCDLINKFIDQTNVQATEVSEKATFITTLTSVVEDAKNDVVRARAHIEAVKEDAFDLLQRDESSYTAEHIDNIVRSSVDISLNASGFINIRPKNEVFFETNIPNTLAYIGDAVSFDKNIMHICSELVVNGAWYSTNNCIFDVSNNSIIHNITKINDGYIQQVIDVTPNTNYIFTVHHIGIDGHYEHIKVFDADNATTFYSSSDGLPSAEEQYFTFFNSGAATRVVIRFKVHAGTSIYKNISFKKATLIVLPAAPTAKIESSTTTTNVYQKGDFVIDNTSDEVYQSQINTSAGDDLADISKFLPKPDVNRQDIILGRRHKITNAFDIYAYGSLNQYSRDEVNNKHSVMSQEGFSFGSNGLWEDDDYYLILMRVQQRLNQGAYHPIFNSLGCADAIVQDAEAHSVRNWYQNDAGEIFNTYSSFLFADGYSDIKTNVFTRSDTGNVSDIYGVGRPDSKFYDKIYNDLGIDCRTSAKNTENSQLLRDELRIDLSGKNEGICAGVETYNLGRPTSSYVTSRNLNTTRGDELFLVGEKITIYNSKDWSKIDVVIDSIYPTYIEWLSIFGTYDKDVDHDVYIVKQNSHLSQNTHLTTDILGDPNNYPQSWKDRLSEGKSISFNPLLVGQDGANYISEDVTGVIAHKKLIDNSPQLLELDDSGEWLVRGFSVGTSAFFLSSNSIEYNFWNSDTKILILNYSANNSILHPYTNGTPLTKDFVVYASNNHDIESGALITNSLTGKVSTGADDLEELAITKEIAGVISHSAPSQIPDVLFRIRLEKDTATGLKKIVYEWDNTLIDGTQKMQRILNEYA